MNISRESLAMHQQYMDQMTARINEGVRALPIINGRRDPAETVCALVGEFKRHTGLHPQIEGLPCTHCPNNQ